jgi:hypothetical protein
MYNSGIVGRYFDEKYSEIHFYDYFCTPAFRVSGFYYGHPIFRYTKKDIKINSRTIFLQKSDRLFLNLTNIHFESDLNSVEHPLRLTTLGIFLSKFSTFANGNLFLKYREVSVL